jgi:hypothetical protein
MSEALRIGKVLIVSSSEVAILNSKTSTAHDFFMIGKNWEFRYCKPNHSSPFEH